MKTKMLVLFFAVLTLSQAGWSQRVDNGTEGLALSNVDELPKGSEVERLLAAYEKGSMPSLETLEKFNTSPNNVYFYQGNRTTTLLSQFIVSRSFNRYSSMLKTINQGLLFDTAYNFLLSDLSANIRNEFFYMNSDCNCMKSDGGFFVRELMGTLIIIQLDFYSNTQIQELEPAYSERIIRNFPSDSEKIGYLQDVYYIFKNK